jgi:hypothetical protein
MMVLPGRLRQSSSAATPLTALAFLTACAAPTPPPPAVATAPICSSAAPPAPAPAAALSTTSPAASAASGCDIIERQQEEALSVLLVKHAPLFSRDAGVREPWLDAAIFRRCQRTDAGAVGLVPMKIGPRGVVTLRASLIDDAGGEKSSRPLHILTPRSWEVFDGAKETLVVVNGGSLSDCRAGLPCTSSRAFGLRFAAGADADAGSGVGGDDLLAPIAERWLGTKAPFPDADQDTPLPWWSITRPTKRGNELLSVTFLWPSLRVGNRLVAGVSGDVDVDLALGVVLDPASLACELAGPIRASHSLWQSAQCERLRGAAVKDLLVALRGRCAWAVATAAGGRDSGILDEDLCVDAAGRDWFLDDEGRKQKPRPAVQLAPGVEQGLARLGPALRNAPKSVLPPGIPGLTAH